MKRLHFQPIQGKASDIIDAILHTEEVASLGNISRIILADWASIWLSRRRNQ